DTPRGGIVDFVGKNIPTQTVDSNSRCGNAQVWIEVRATGRRNRGEVAIAKRDRRNRVRKAQQRRLFEPLDAEEKECFPVALRKKRNRTANCSAKVAAAVSRTLQMTVSITGERITGVQCLVDEVLVSASVKLARARLHCDVEETTPCLPEFRSIVAGLHGDFLNGVGARLVFLQRETHFVVCIVQS